MKVHIPSSTRPSALLSSPIRWTCQTCLLLPARRSFFWNSKSKEESVTSNPILERYLKNKPKKEIPRTEFGAAAEDSIFADEEKRGPVGEKTKPKNVRNLDSMALVLDPDPRGRMRWERKMVIRQIQNRGRLSRAQQLKRTEREHLNKSHFMKTSIKKLGMLARQIAGKPIEEAIVQMQFSKKKAAQDIKAQLELARDEAVVKRGMGLGQANGTQGDPIQIRLKDGTKKTVTDRTGMYIDQAWVGRGTYEKELEYRAKGRVNILRKPYTSISVLLKEEATRVRLHNERVAKRDRRKTWVQLPDRPISEQRQYPLW